jgi:hypothetical protein
MTYESFPNELWRTTLSRLGGTAAIEAFAREMRAFLRSPLRPATGLLRLIPAYRLSGMGSDRPAPGEPPAVLRTFPMWLCCGACATAVPGWNISRPGSLEAGPCLWRAAGERLLVGILHPDPLAHILAQGAHAVSARLAWILWPPMGAKPRRCRQLRDATPAPGKINSLEVERVTISLALAYAQIVKRASPHLAGSSSIRKHHGTLREKQNRNARSQ